MKRQNDEQILRSLINDKSDGPGRICWMREILPGGAIGRALCNGTPKIWSEAHQRWVCGDHAKLEPQLTFL